ncbi:MAG TPA: hypothetical protein VK932_03065 [Kofleriaceae bacterium]|nr:hypothetical protein [Kofleriaceae bacterium]
MSTQRDRLGSSGVFKVIVDVSRKIKRALSESDRELSPAAEELAHKVAQAFIAGRYADVHALGTPSFQGATRRDRFEASWTEATADYRPLTGFAVSDYGPIELAFIPGLEETPQSQFVAFVEITFSSVDIPVDSESAFTIGVVLLDQGGALRIGALHAR